MRYVIGSFGLRRGDFNEHSNVDIALLTKRNRTDSWKYNDKIDEVATELALKYFAIVNFVLLPYNEFEENTVQSSFHTSGKCSLYEKRLSRNCKGRSDKKCI